MLTIGDWVLDIDLAKTMELSCSQAKTHCQCGYCQNFYDAVDQSYPTLRSFLSRFGLDIEGPDELAPFEPTILEVSYIVQGRILKKGSEAIYVDDIPAQIISDSESDLETEHPFPYFVLKIGLLELPWIQEIAVEEVISPANEPEYLQRMEAKLMKLLDNDPFYS